MKDKLKATLHEDDVQQKGRAPLHKPFHNFLFTSTTDSHYLPNTDSLYTTRLCEFEPALLNIL